MDMFSKYYYSFGSLFFETSKMESGGDVNTGADGENAYAKKQAAEKELRENGFKYDYLTPVRFGFDINKFKHDPELSGSNYNFYYRIIGIGKTPKISRIMEVDGSYYHLTISVANPQPNTYKEEGGDIAGDSIIDTLKKNIEQRTGLKVSTRLQKTGSMRGYVTFRPKSVGGKFVDFDSVSISEMKSENPGHEPHPNFWRKESIDIYVGNEVFNHEKKSNACKNCGTEISASRHICDKCKTDIEEQKMESGKDQFYGYTINYGRPKGMSSKVKSAGWGVAPNYVHSLMSLTKENLDRCPQLNPVRLKNETKITREQAYVMADELIQKK